MRATHFILYVKDQARSRDFYQHLLDQSPRLDVPGMTEFELSSGLILGLMPWSSITKILDLDVAQSSSCEIYLVFEDAEPAFQRGVAAGARVRSPFSQRNWGARVAYLEDLDGHIVALADGT